MPRIRTWHRISHDFNRDPEVRELRRRFGDWMALVWIEMLSISSRNDGRVPGQLEHVAESLSHVSVSVRHRYLINKILLAIRFMSDCGWIRVESNAILIVNSLKYKEIGGHVAIPQGNTTLPIIEKNRIEKNRIEDIEIAASRKKDNGSAAWPDSDLWLKEFLEGQNLIPSGNLLDHGWWMAVGQSLNGLDRSLLGREFAKMSAWLNEHRNRTPTARGWKRFVRTWLERAEEKERRFRK